MTPLVQELLAYAAVALASGWLLQRWVRGRRSKATCDHCGPAAGGRTLPPRRGVRPRSLRVLR